MNIKEYEEEIKKGCRKTFDIDDPNYITFCGVTCHTQHPDDLGLGVDLCQECRGKWEAIQKCKEMFKEMIEKFRTELRKCDEFFNVKDYDDIASTDKFAGIVDLFLDKEILSQLNGEEEQ